jgi:hypothetical protein
MNLNRVKLIEKRRKFNKDENEIELNEIEEKEEQSSNSQMSSAPPGKLKRAEKVLFLATIITIMTPVAESIEQNYIVLMIKFKSPCESLDVNMTSPSKIQWCQKQFDFSYQQPVNNFCKSSRDIVLFENELYRNKSLRIKRDNNSNNKTDNTDVSQYVISSIVSSLTILKEVTTTIGQIWQRNKIDHKLLENSLFQIELPQNVKLYKFRPLICLADFHCANLILILKKNDKSVWYEDYCLEFLLTIVTFCTTTLICIGIRHYLLTRRLETSNFKITYDRRLSEQLIERNLPLPPLSFSTEILAFIG